MSDNLLPLFFETPDSSAPLSVTPIKAKTAAEIAEREHYMHRRPMVTHAFGLYQQGELRGVCIFGTPASHHLQKGVCPSNPSLVTELNRLWVNDLLGRNTESWFVSRCFKMIPPLIVVSYADTAHGYAGYIYRALNFYYAGWTDMERATPRPEYTSLKDGMHSPRGVSQRSLRVYQAHSENPLLDSCRKPA